MTWLARAENMVLIVTRRQAPVEVEDAAREAVSCFAEAQRCRKVAGWGQREADRQHRMGKANFAKAKAWADK